MTAHRLVFVCALIFAWPFNAIADTMIALRIHVNAAENTISVDATLPVGRDTPGPFHLSSDFRVASVRQGDASVAFHHAKDVLTLTPTGPSSEHIQISYAGEPTGSPLTTAGGVLDSHANWVPFPRTGITHYRLDVSTHAPFRAVAPGKVQEEKIIDGTHRARIESEAPGEYPTVFVGPYHVRERIVDGISLRTYFHAELSSLADGYLEDTQRYIQRYAKQIGPYPFSSFSVVSGPHPVGYGFPGLTYMGRRVLRLPFIRKTSLGHEVLHCWWGNGVFVDAREGNWAEGLTTFMADYAYAEDKDADAARTKRIHWLRDYAALPPDRDQAANRFVGKGHDASQVIGYNKVAYFFHMLRNHVGEETFYPALRRFWRDHRFKAATWSDLRQAFNQEAQRDLAPFFAQWLTRTGAPSLQLADAVYHDGEISLNITQSTPPFALSLPVRVTTENGDQWHQVAIDTTSTPIRLPVKALPTAVAVDPDSHVFRRLSPNEAPPILRDVTLSKGTLSVIVYGQDTEQDAAKKLVKRLMDQPPLFAPPYLSPSDTDPFLVIGPPDEVAAYLNGIGLMAAPDEVANRGSAQVWTGRRGGQPYLVIAAERAADVAALMRPLPHYRRSSWLVFDGSRAIDHGTWPITDGPLVKRF